MRAAASTAWHHRRASTAVALVLPVLISAACAEIARTAAPATDPPVARPNVVIIVTDDHPWSMIDQLPSLDRDVREQGTTFRNAFVVNALCCPSRATILAGGYSHTTGVFANNGTHGGFGAFDDDATLATWLHDAGYRTALIGKYMNQYLDETYVPPGWDTWRAFVGPTRYYDYALSIDGVRQTFGSSDEEYSTDVFASYADAFIRETPAEQPLLLYLTPYAPHPKAIPADRHATARIVLPPRPPNFNEADVTDKPTWVRSLPVLTRTGDAQRRRMHRTLLAADDMIGQVVRALAETGRLHDTLLIVTADNGWSQGSHRWIGKTVPWDESIRVPMIVRYDPVTGGVERTDEHLALNLDIARTVIDVAGVAAAPGVEGSSLLPLLDGSIGVGDWREDFLIEHLRVARRDVLPTYCAVRSETVKYVRYSTGEEELYDLVADPFELESLHAHPATTDLLETMRRRLAELCSPPPPGYAPI